MNRLVVFERFINKEDAPPSIVEDGASVFEDLLTGRLCGASLRRAFP